MTFCVLEVLDGLKKSLTESKGQTSQRDFEKPVLAFFPHCSLSAASLVQSQGPTPMTNSGLEYFLLFPFSLEYSYIRYNMPILFLLL